MCVTLIHCDTFCTSLSEIMPCSRSRQSQYPRNCCISSMNSNGTPGQDKTQHGDDGKVDHTDLVLRVLPYALWICHQYRQISKTLSKNFLFRDFLQHAVSVLMPQCSIQYVRDLVRICKTRILIPLNLENVWTMRYQEVLLQR